MAEDKLPERVTKIETILDFHEKRLESLEKGMNDLSHKVEEVLTKVDNIEKELTIKGIKWFLERVGLPIFLVIITSIILRGI
jgi:chromosome segregation ATPase